MADATSPTIRTFQVFPDVPRRSQPLLELAHNLWWVWHPDAVELFRRLDRKLWDEVYHNPVKLLGAIDAGEARRRGRGRGLPRPHEPRLRRVQAAPRRARAGISEHARRQVEAAGRVLLRRVRAARVAADLLRRPGHPRGRSPEERQRARPAAGRASGCSIATATSSSTSPPTAGSRRRTRSWTSTTCRSSRCATPTARRCTCASTCRTTRSSARSGRRNVGRIPLYLLDTNLPENAPADRDITARLYGGGTEMRIKQEIVLGIGGVRALEALNITADRLPHERRPRARSSRWSASACCSSSSRNLTFDEARQQVMATNVFTTHTPVPAGIDMFPPDMMLKYFKNYIPSLKLDEEGFLALGREDVDEQEAGLLDGGAGDPPGRQHQRRQRAARRRVAARCGTTSGRRCRRTRCRSSTSPTASTCARGSRPDIAFVLDRYLSDEWMTDPTDQSVWEGVDADPRRRAVARPRALPRAAGRLGAADAARAAHPARRQRTTTSPTADEVLDPEALTIGFARRFATYKRGALLLRDPNRLRRLLEDTKRPIQFVFAGKAHPADHEGKELIKAIVNFARDPAVRRRMVFIENYDMNVARYLVQGVDVWLNTPRRAIRSHRHQRHEGGRQRRAELLDPRRLVGRGLRAPTSAGRSAAARRTPTPTTRTSVESQALYDILEKQIIPLFYKRGVDNIPREWIARMKNCMRKLAPVFNTNRMVQRLRREVLHPRARRAATTLAADGLQARRRAGARQGHAARSKWGGIKIVGVHTSGNGHFKVGETMQVEALVDLPGHRPEGRARSSSTPARSTRRGEIEQPQVADDGARRSRWPRTGTCSSARSTAAPAAGRASRSASCPATRTWRRRSSRG